MTNDTYTHITDIFDREMFQQMLDNKYIKVQTHPTYLNIKIANYTEQATWERMWNYVTLNCRGLIWDEITGTVLARPFPKFFNGEEPSAPEYSAEDLFTATDKMDGSLGILYPTPDGYAIATRGSFTSDQAVWATNLLHTKYAGWTPDPRWTYCFEIIYPENRIVVDYGDMTDLVLLGGVTPDGWSAPLSEIFATWDGPTTTVYAENATLREILEMPPRENAEGFVLHHAATDTRIKVKYEDYKILHRFMTNTSEKHVWEVIASGQDPALVFAAAPDEFHEWLRGVIDTFYGDYQDIYLNVYLAYEKIKRELPTDYTRKDFALAVKAANLPFSSLFFLLEDGDEERIQNFIWQQLKPKGTRTMRMVSNDAN